MKGRFFNERYVVVNLENGEIDERELSSEVLEKAPGGPLLALHLLEDTGGTAAFAAGLFTGTFVPASCASTLVWLNEATGPVVTHLLWHTGAELKYSGFDAVVLKGKSSERVYLWIHDGICEVLPASALNTESVWTLVDSVRGEHADENIQVISYGKEGGLKPLMVDYWYSGDICGAGDMLDNLNVQAVALRGMESFEADEDFFSACVELRRSAVSEECKGMGRVLELSGADTGPLEKIKERVHRYSACFNCPYPCQSFLMVKDEPSRLKESEIDEPGFLLSDPFQTLALVTGGSDVIETMWNAVRTGTHPLEALYHGKELSTVVEEIWQDVPGWFKNFVKKCRASLTLPPGDCLEDAVKRYVFSLSAGVCPIFTGVFSVNLSPVFGSIKYDYGAFEEQVHSTAKVFLDAP